MLGVECVDVGDQALGNVLAGRVVGGEVVEVRGRWIGGQVGPGLQALRAQDPAQDDEERAVGENPRSVRRLIRRTRTRWATPYCL